MLLIFSWSLCSIFQISNYWYFPVPAYRTQRYMWKHIFHVNVCNERMAQKNHIILKSIWKTQYTHTKLSACTHSEISNDNVDSLRKKNCSHSVTLLSTATHTIIEWVITNRKYNLFYLLQREQQHVEHLMILSFQVVCDAILQRQTNQTHTLMTPFFFCTCFSLKNRMIVTLFALHFLPKQTEC